MTTEQEDEKSWEEWIRLVAEEYGLNLEKKDRETEKQKRILEAAMHIFSERGFEGASTSAIAERAQVAEATIFKHYRSKKGLLLHLVIPAISRVATPFILRPVLKILDQDKPSEELFRELYADRVRLVERNWKKIKIIVVESLFQPELREALQDHVARSIYEVMSERIGDWQREGRLRDDLPTHVVARSILSIGIGYLLAKNIFPRYLAQGEEEQELAWMAEVLLHGIAGPKEKEEG
ncbi:TetR family transcriptional regulator [Melghirimyces profundicolus]|uniref:TetR family transcriptional regulator n=1 Tax=Melghirimyces profundicolus TaxID=1242148 RepID=A0A2T6C9I5_9BACL|nr:TetR/AcrR family transcriptional regulator [Melghirimyces profundicolus]PTX64995.1 TetR family transcriptional regulator [Melghirimyces profundicolus]